MTLSTVLSRIYAEERNNLVTLHNGAALSTKYPFNLACEPANVKCPGFIQSSEIVTMKNIERLTVVHGENIYIIEFPYDGNFQLSVSKIISSDPVKDDHGHCRLDQVIDELHEIRCIY